MCNRLQTTWCALGAMALLAGMLVLGGCSARSGAGETAAQATIMAGRQPTPGPALPTPTPTAASEPPAAGAIFPTPTPSGTPIQPAAPIAAAPAAPPGEAPLLLDLPALVIAYDEAGAPSIGGSTPLSDLNALLPPALISQLTLDAALVQRATAAGIQNLMVSNTPSGLRILVNGQPLPTVVWDQQSLDNLLALLAPAADSPLAALRELVGTLTNLGIGLVVQLPSGSDTPPPMIAGGAASNAARAQADLAAFLARAGAPPVVQIPVEYGADGAWTVGGMSDTEWQALTGLPFGYIRLNPALLQGAAEAGFRQAVLWTDAEGVHLTLGDLELPYLRWADGGIHTLIDLLLRLEVLQGAASDQQMIDLLLEQWLPAVQATELRIVVNFPEE